MNRSRALALLAAGLAALVVIAAACAPAKKDGNGPGPTTADPSTYTRVSVAGDPSPSGIFDPYVVYPAGGADGWLSYSGVLFHSSGGNLVQDVQTNIAHSIDAGATWTFVQTAAAVAANVTMTFPDSSVCGSTSCTGHFIPEVSFLIDDETDPNPNARWKLFEHRYFLYPPLQAQNASTVYTEGAIFMQTAASPDGTWTAGTPVLGWNLTPPEISAAQNVQTLGSAASGCLAISEGGGIARGSEIDLVFACVYLDGGTPTQKILLLKSTDHAASFTLTGDLLANGDTASIGGAGPTAPALTWDGTTAHLLVTLLGSTGLYAGCASVPVDLDAGTVARDGADPAWDEIIPTQSNRFGGACTWAPGASANGVLAIQLDLDGNPPDPFRIYATHVGP